MTQEKPARRSQADRRAETRAKLIEAARAYFVEIGFADTATPDIVRKAGVTRGALYHHFKDKTDLFRALAEEEAKAIADHIDRATYDVTDPERAIETGSNAFFDAMMVPGRVRILMEKAPAVLGHTNAVALTRANGSEELRLGLSRALPEQSSTRIDALTNLLSAEFDRAALEIAYGGDPVAYKAAMHQLVERVQHRRDHTLTERNSDHDCRIHTKPCRGFDSTRLNTSRRATRLVTARKRTLATLSNRSYAVVSGILLKLDQAQQFEGRTDVICKALAIILAQTAVTADRVAF